MLQMLYWNVTEAMLDVAEAILKCYRGYDLQYTISRDAISSKKLQCQNSTDTPLKLETPEGTYSEDDVLEGFAADAEHLGRARGETDMYDNEFIDYTV